MVSPDTISDRHVSFKVNSIRDRDTVGKHANGDVAVNRLPEKLVDELRT
jgi:hypothetical protein